MTLPAGVRAVVGLADCDLVDVRVSGSRIIVTPTLVIDRSKFPDAEDQGPFYGPFKNGAGIAAFLEKRQGSRRPAKSNQSR